jgi:hypothetical protein
MITNYTTKERIEQLEKLISVRERAFENLQKYRKVRIDHRTVALVPLEKLKDYETQMDGS